ncbi:dermonecrotic toxin domain-containing protein [Pseudomonas sp. H11T01]|uniref:dermonecrotic toxin domain-containing protein n=1 Tax=Pseudomonas sp. H11T01 TaxID=3402749 RepID=UPI003AD22C02
MPNNPGLEAQVPFDTLAQAVSTQFQYRPTVLVVALEQFSKALQGKYPGIHIDVPGITLNSPNWVIENSVPRLDGYRRTPLLEVVIESITGNAVLDYTDEHFLSIRIAHRLNVDMREVEDLLRGLPGAMIPALQQALVSDWNESVSGGGSRWQWLSDAFRTALLTRLGSPEGAASLDVEEHDTLLQVISCPQKAPRLKAYGPDCAQAFLVDYKARFAGMTFSSLGTSVLVKRKVLDREVVLLYSLSGVIETFTSLREYSDSQGRRLGRELQIDELELQPYESLGNVFVTQTQALLNEQLEGLKLIGPFIGQTLEALELRNAQLTDVAASLLRPASSAAEQARFIEVRKLLPNWLQQAHVNDVWEYSRYMSGLATLQMAAAGKSYKDGIPTLEVFTRQTLEAQMRTRYPDATTLNPDMIEITQYLYSGGSLGGTAIGGAEVVKESLTHRALNNLVAGLPHANTTIKYQDGSSIPYWMTADYLRQLIRQVDIGRTYPELIRTTLLGNERIARETLFIDQLRTQLPMLALENKSKSTSGITEEGYRYVAALMLIDSEARRVDGKEIRIRPLAFEYERSKQPDVVINMFVIDNDSEFGPSILYRPMHLQEPLRQFESRSDLMKAILEDTALQESILSWFSRSAWAIYANGGFLDTPQYQNPTDDFPVPIRPKAARLAGQTFNGDPLPWLYEANANAMAHLANDQTVSNAENDQGVRTALGWAVFNSLLDLTLPLLNGSAAVVGWLGQMAVSFKQAIDAEQGGDREPEKELMTSLLVNLALVLLVHKFTTRSTLPIRPKNEPSLPGLLPRTGTGTQAPSEISVQLKELAGPAGFLAKPETVLNFSSPVSANSRALLERFIINNPDGLGPVIRDEPLKGMQVRDGRWYARVPGRIRGSGWARVTPAGDDAVCVLDNHGKPIQWLQLKNNGQDLWEIAPEFRVQGGGVDWSALGRHPLINAERAARSARIGACQVRLKELEKSAGITYQRSKGEYEKFAVAAGKFRARKAQLEGLDEETLARDPSLIELKKQMFAAEDKSMKASQGYAQSQQNYVAELDTVRTILLEDKEYERNALFKNLHERLHRYLDIESALAILTGIWQETGLTLQDVFPLAYDRVTSSGRIPYSVLLKVRKRVLSHLPERIEMNQKIESMAAELFEWDERLSKGAQTTEVKGRVAARRGTADQLIVQELVLMRGALAGDPEYARTDIELAALQGLSRARVATVTEYVLEIRGSEGYTPNERILVLKDAIARYVNAETLGHYLEAPWHKEGAVPQDHLKSFLDKLAGLRISAEEELATLTRETVLGEPGPQTPEQTTNTPNKKRIRKKSKRVIETIDGVQMGDVRVPGTSEPDETLVVHDPDTELDTTFYKHGDDTDWQQRVVQPVPVPRVARGLNNLSADGTRLLAQVEGFIARVRSYSNRSQEPKSLEDILHIQAAKLDDLASEISRGMAGFGERDTETATQMSNNLRTNSASLKAEGRRLRIEGVRQLPPSAGNFEYLLGQGEISNGNAVWTDKTTAKGPDFLLEYPILDEKNLDKSGRKKVFWYAHFHCATQKTESMRKGHLKLATLRFKTYEDQLREANNSQIGVIESGDISVRLARKLFFKTGS